ncbi:cilia- and flagella-associated protein 100 isoform X2 [Notolabrus celidotus]|uniref:cilia- and flagella-associated protein 100 isoform X2 n=1 Tax=Notolabrus celidotus TaxID=1203425 RepID=UPI00148F8CE2|nr:cilia- and flagella-associated protein 100 isoform X2 [Notolabrus celidotus]
MNKRVNQKEDNKLLALQTDEMMTRTRDKTETGLVGHVKKEEGETEKEIKTRTSFNKQDTGRQELKTATMKQEAIKRDSKHDFVSMERQKAILQYSLMTKQSAISRMDKAIAKEERQLKELETILKKDNLKFEEVLRENEKKSVEARAYFELEAKSKQEKNVKIKKLSAEIGSTMSDLIKFEEILIDYKRYKELLFKLSPPEWQQAQTTKRVKILTYQDALDKPTMEPGLESKFSNPGSELTSIRETQLSSAHSNTLVNPSTLERDSSEYDNDPVLYFTDPQQLLDLVKELTEQNLSLIQNSSRLVETLEEYRQSMETNRKKIEKDEEQLTLQINDMIQMIDKEKAKGAKLKQKVQLHISLNTEDQDIMWDTLDEKVAEIHYCCVDDRMTNLSTLEKLTNIENHISFLLKSLESIPEESLGMMRKIKDSERRSRHRENRLKEQREKQKERMKRYLEKSLADSKKMSMRKLMPRCMPVTRRVRVSHGDNTSTEEEIYAFLFTPEDMN